MFKFGGHDIDRLLRRNELPDAVRREDHEPIVGGDVVPHHLWLCDHPDRLHTKK
jgi:hypothetical protein